MHMVSSCTSTTELVTAIDGAYRLSLFFNGEHKSSSLDGKLNSLSALTFFTCFFPWLLQDLPLWHFAEQFPPPFLHLHLPACNQ